MTSKYYGTLIMFFIYMIMMLCFFFKKFWFSGDGRSVRMLLGAATGLLTRLPPRMFLCLEGGTTGTNGSISISII